MQSATAAPSMQRAEPMPPRAGSDRVAEVPMSGARPAPPSPAAPSPADQLTATLESLAALRDKGLITPEEYEAKKRDLLGRM
jgi:hypothetical protein